MKKLCHIIVAVLLFTYASVAEELPVPRYSNSVIISIEHLVTDTFEVDYILNNINFGLYAWPSFSKTPLSPVLDWHGDWSDASNGIQSFKNSTDNLIQAANAKKVKLHIVLCSGLSRVLSIYREAKEEDVRNCQWFNDNNLASDVQMGDPDAMDTYVFGTLSRYARKMRLNLEAKAQAAGDFLAQRMIEEPDVLVASGWGEAELNFNRINFLTSLQEFFCDYSPFAILEFRDWICHTGMYDDSTGVYAGQGYASGGSQYQGTQGLTQFNTDFGTAFSSWDLRYFHWSLADDHDPNNQDDINLDPGRIPLSSYSQGNMMPSSGSDYIEGGFDPPRTMTPGNAFYDLWHLFRETMVHNFVMDMAKWISSAGVPADRWYSHQIPGDYLFGTHPGSTSKDPRYYSSASALWTANIQPYGSMGASIYDIKFPPDVYPPEFARTSTYLVPDISSLSPNWAAMEYDAETYPPGYSVVPSSPQFIQAQYQILYNHNVHLINFFKWIDTSGSDSHTIKGTNKEIALQGFVDAIRDKARSVDLNVVYSPPKVGEVIGSYIPATQSCQLNIGEEIWMGHDWEWLDWGDFMRFEIFRSTQSGFKPKIQDRIGTSTDYVYTDSTITPGTAYFYKIRAKNSQGVPGPFSDEIMVVPSSVPVPVLHVSKSHVSFGAIRGGVVSSPVPIAVMNLGQSGTNINWTATPQGSWLNVTPTFGSGDGLVEISADHSGLATGTYSGQVLISDPNAFNSPQAIEVELRVYRSGNDDPPFGKMETPIDGSTVSGNIPVSGWALDDIELDRVQIKRNAHPDDPPGAIGADGLVFVGNAYFVRGARPDVESAYPDYPNNERAGWGCMVLTNFLPNGGNGDFTLYAIAFDVTGHRVEIGQKLIHCDNANRVTPFGSIDTPGLGEVISGVDYVNFGWALTPPPKMIPTDGSTIWVFVDGVPLGHPVYNQYREDIATRFPGYLNSNGAVGYYYLDTTQFANGVHILAWSITDDAGAVDGMSRYFEVQNFGTAVASLLQTTWLSYLEDASGQLPIRISRMGQGKHTKGKKIRDFNIGKSNEIDQTQVEAGDVMVIEIEELERVVLNFEGRADSRFIGWGKDGLSQLPIGSTLDEKAGVFYWIPGPGFLGEHILHFAATDGTNKGKSVKVIIRIRPKLYKN